MPIRMPKSKRTATDLMSQQDRSRGDSHAQKKVLSNFYLPVGLKARLQDYAEEHGRPMTQVLIDALERYLDARGA